MEICQKSLEKGEPLTRDYLRTFIDLVNDTEDADIMLMLMQLLNALIGKKFLDASGRALPPGVKRPLVTNLFTYRSAMECLDPAIGLFDVSGSDVRSCFP